jgi:2'-hydroxyisoflavone reductase
LLEECRTVSGSDTRFTWVGDKFLTAAGVGEWMELPLWLSEEKRGVRGFMSVDCSKAIAHGLRFRPLAETIRDTLDWAGSLSEPSAPDTSHGAPRTEAGMEPEREAQLLKEWHESQEQAEDELAVS